MNLELDEPTEHDQNVQQLCNELAEMAKRRAAELHIDVAALSILLDARTGDGTPPTFSMHSIGYDSTQEMVETTIAHLIEIAVELGLPGATVEESPAPAPGTPGFHI